MFQQVQRLLHYLLGKSSELSALESKDALLAKVVLDIHRLRSHSRFVQVPLFALHKIHAIDRDNALEATARRVETLQAARQDLLRQRHLSREFLARYLPSVSGIKVVQQDRDTYIAYEGNGRLQALQTVFTPEDRLMVEVEEYCFDDANKILRRMQRVRRKNGLA